MDSYDEFLNNLDAASVNEQILKYEHFVDVVLRGDLKRVAGLHEDICQKIVEHMNVKSAIKAIKDNDIRSFKSMTDIGCNCYAKSVVWVIVSCISMFWHSVYCSPDTNKIYFNVGLNCIVELTLDEALKFIEKRIKMYNCLLEEHVETSSKIKAHIKIILNLIDQLKSNV